MFVCQKFVWEACFNISPGLRLCPDTLKSICHIHKLGWIPLDAIAEAGFDG